MKLMLDHTQRLNLHALLGAQRADVGSIRAIWAIQDRLALSADEEKAIELKRDIVAGRERVLWNPALSITAREFEFTSAETARIRASIESWDQYSPSADRRWLEPLMIVLFSNDISTEEQRGMEPNTMGSECHLQTEFRRRRGWIWGPPLTAAWT